MYKIFVDLLEKERASWLEELARYNLILNRGSPTPEEALKLDFFKGCIFAILKELEELEEKAKEEEPQKKYKIIKLYTRTFKSPNGEEGIGFYTYYPVFVAGEENLGPQVKGIKIYFNKSKVDTNLLKYGDTLLVEKDKMTIPLYQIVDGKYPYIWIDEIEDIMHEEERGTIK